ncbi:MAG: T9SS type A sorting domain-containing protein [Saprospiraceae bacterium]|nr:T9SS type A sorting domain-containing protein [Saprospiraceae bacterium]
MKRIIPGFLLLLAAFGIGAQTVTDVQTTLITKRTADWCPYCGSYGWQFTTQLKPMLVDKDAIMWNVHHSGGLATNTSKAIASNIGGVGQPLIYLNTETDDIGLTAGNVSAKVNEVAQLVDDLALFGAIIGMGGEAKVNPANTLTAKAKIEFYDSAESGEFYVGMYTVKKNLVAFQQSVGQNAVHHAVLDQSLTTGFFGNKVATAPITQGAIFETTATLENLVLHNGKLEDTKVVMVIWNKVAGGKYIFINAREVNLELDQTSSVGDIDQKVMNFAATAGNGFIDVTLDCDPVKELDFTILDINGRIQRAAIKPLDSRRFRLDNLQLPAGSYFVQLKSGQQVISRQVFYTH